MEKGKGYIPGKGKGYILGGMVILCYLWIVVLGNDPLQPAIASKILRFHVLANSDSKEDQAVKLKVRDAVGDYMAPLLEEAEDLEETRQIVEARMEEIIKVAQETLTEEGYEYPVSASLTETLFPEKTYGSYTFPKGTYEALQIVLGEGKGENWWCVLYPNMCFRGAVYEVVDEEADPVLREVLSPWEYADVFEGGEVEIRWKWWEEIKLYLQKNTV